MDTESRVNIIAKKKSKNLHKCTYKNLLSLVKYWSNDDGRIKLSIPKPNLYVHKFPLLSLYAHF